jgi:hypothetical protein
MKKTQEIDPTNRPNTSKFNSSWPQNENALKMKMPSILTYCNLSRMEFGKEMFFWSLISIATTI